MVELRVFTTHRADKVSGGMVLHELRRNLAVRAELLREFGAKGFSTLLLAAVARPLNECIGKRSHSRRRGQLLIGAEKDEIERTEKRNAIWSAGTGADMLSA